MCVCLLFTWDLCRCLNTVNLTPLSGLKNFFSLSYSTVYFQLLNVLGMLGKLTGESLVQASERRTGQASELVSDPPGYCPDCLPAPERAYCFQEARGTVGKIEGLDLQSAEPLEGVWPSKLRVTTFHDKASSVVIQMKIKPELRFACRLVVLSVCSLGL